MNLKEIIENYLTDIGVTKPHLQCIVVSQGLRLHLLEEHNINTKEVTFDVDMKHYNGVVYGHMSLWNIIEHVCVMLDDGIIIDATASQFNIADEVPMPRIYIGPIPQFYLNQQ